MKKKAPAIPILYFLNRFYRKGKLHYQWTSDDFLESGIVKADSREAAKKKIIKEVDPNAIFWR